jgi:hypothetical protein
LANATPTPAPPPSLASPEHCDTPNGQPGPPDTDAVQDGDQNGPDNPVARYGQSRCGTRDGGKEATMTDGRIIAVSVAIVGAAIPLMLTGCGNTRHLGGGSAATSPAESNPPGDIPDNQVFVVYTAPDHAFTVKYPEGWARTDTGATVVFSDKFNNMSITSRPGVHQPNEDFARSMEVPQIASTTPGFVPGTVTTVQRPAGQVVLITYQADSPASPVTGKSVKLAAERYEFSKLDGSAVVTLSAPLGSDNVDPWRVVTDSFTWLSG